MGPISPVVERQQKVGFAPTTSMVVLGEKLGTDSGTVILLNSVDDYVKGCYALTV
jgi:hypothetical protein